MSNNNTHITVMHAQMRTYIQSYRSFIGKTSINQSALKEEVSKLERAFRSKKDSVNVLRLSQLKK